MTTSLSIFYFAKKVHFCLLWGWNPAHPDVLGMTVWDILIHSSQIQGQEFGKTSPSAEPHGLAAEFEGEWKLCHLNLNEPQYLETKHLFSTYSFPAAAVTNDHKLCVLKHCRPIILHFWRSEVPQQSPCSKSNCGHGGVLPKASGENVCPSRWSGGRLMPGLLATLHLQSQGHLPISRSLITLLTILFLYQ